MILWLSQLRKLTVHDLSSPSITQSCQVDSAVEVLLSESDSLGDSCVKNDSDVTADVEIENKKSDTSGKDLKKDIDNQCVKAEDTKLPEMAISETVWAVVTLENSLQTNLSAQDLKRVEKFLTRHDH